MINNRNFAIWEVLRSEEFSPLKNSVESKSETPVTCRQDLSSLHTKWLENAGALFVDNVESNEDSYLECEISPLVSYSGEVSDFLWNIFSFKFKENNLSNSIFTKGPGETC